MILGIDVSTILEEYNNGAKFYDNGRLLKKFEPLDMFRDNGVTYMRIRLWNNPYDSDGNKYLGGTCDLDNFLKLAKIAQDKGYKILLDFHYSDFWADPGKQKAPKEWENLTFGEVVDKVYEYTLETLKKIKDEDIDIGMVQIGNEITNGMIHPYGRLIEDGDNPRQGYEKLIELLKSGIKGVKEIYPNAKIIIHLERSYDQKIYNEYFNKLIEADVNFDVIGASYYPYWHGTMDEFFANMDNCKKFNKELMVMELGYAFTLEDYILNNNGDINLVVNKDNLSSFAFTETYPLNKEGQARFIEDFLSRAKEKNIGAVFYWEPLWIPGDGICWASRAGLKYIGEENKSTRNEWANQCLFDYDGNKLPSFDKFKL